MRHFLAGIFAALAIASASAQPMSPGAMQGVPNSCSLANPTQCPGGGGAGVWQRQGQTDVPSIAADQFPGTAAGVQEPTTLPTLQTTCSIVAGTSCYRGLYTGGTGSFSLVYRESLDAISWVKLPTAVLTGHRTSSFFQLTASGTASFSGTAMTVITVGALPYAVGQTLTGANGVTGKTITALASGTGGAGTVYTISGSVGTVATEAVTGIGEYVLAANTGLTQLDLYVSPLVGTTALTSLSAGILTTGTAGTWGAGLLANTSVTIIGTTLYILVEGETVANIGTIGEYTANVADPTAWTANASNPVISNASHLYADPSRIFTLSNGQYSVWYYCAAGTSAGPSDVCMATASSPNPAAWVAPYAVVFGRSTADEGVNTTAGQIADVELFDVTVAGQTKCFMQYTGTFNGTSPGSLNPPLVGNFVEKLATADIPCESVALTAQGSNAGSFGIGEQPGWLRGELQPNDIRVSGLSTPATGQYSWLDEQTDNSTFAQGRFFAQGPTNSIRGQWNWYIQTANGGSQLNPLSIDQFGDVNANGNLQALAKFFITFATPASSGASCTKNQLEIDATYIYGCTATNTWQSVPWGAFQTGYLPLSGGTLTGGLTIGSAPFLWGIADSSNGTPAAAGTGYNPGDLITLNDGCTTHGVLGVNNNNASNAAITVYNVVVKGSCASPPPNPVAQASTTGTGSGATFTLTYAPYASILDTSQNVAQNGGNIFLGGPTPTTFYGSETTCVGVISCRSIASGNYTTVLGHGSNGAVGCSGLIYSNAIVAIGVDAIRNGCGQTSAIAIGFAALRNYNQIGTSVNGYLTGTIAIGPGAMTNWNGTGATPNNTVIGSNAGVGAAATYINSTCIGAGTCPALTSGQNQTQIGGGYNGGQIGPTCATGNGVILIGSGRYVVDCPAAGTAAYLNIENIITTTITNSPASSITTIAGTENVSGGQVIIGINGSQMGTLYLSGSASSSANLTGGTTGVLTSTSNVTLSGLATAGTIAGSICATSGGSILYESGASSCTISLEEIKHDIAPLTTLDPIGDLMALRPIVFTYNHIEKARPQFGFGAHQVETVNPALSTYDGNGDLQAYDPNGILALTVATVQAQQREIEWQRLGLIIAFVWLAGLTGCMVWRRRVVA